MKNFVSKFQKKVEQTRYKICLALPNTGTFRKETVMAILGLQNETPHDLYIAEASGCYIEDNRRRLIEMGRKANCQYLFFLDSDVWVEPQTINKLLEMKKPIIGADYNMRAFPLTSNIKLMGEDGQLIGGHPELLPTTPAKVFGVPTGAMLIDLSIMDKIPQPWFDLEYKADGSLEWGEDIYFCKKAQQYGIEVWVHPNIDTRHIGTHPY